MITQQTKEQLGIYIRWMVYSDVPEVLQIEKQSFDYPWEEEDLLRCLRQPNHIGMVAELDRKVVGFMIYEMKMSELHVLNFAVHPKYRRNGVGRRMVGNLIKSLRIDRRTHITLNLRETNLGAQLFFRSQRFRVISTFRGYYRDSGEDAYFMEYKMDGL